MAYVYDVSLICNYIWRIETKADMLLNACKDIGLAVKIGNIKYMKAGCHRDTLANEHITVVSNCYGQLKTFKFLTFLLTNKNSVHQKI